MCYIDLSNNGTGTGSMAVQGLPFPVADLFPVTSIQGGTNVGYFSGISTATSSLMMAPRESTSEASVYRTAGGGSTTVLNATESAWGNSGTLRATFSYCTDS